MNNLETALRHLHSVSKVKRHTEQQAELPTAMYVLYHER